MWDYNSISNIEYAGWCSIVLTFFLSFFRLSVSYRTYVFLKFFPSVCKLIIFGVCLYVNYIWGLQNLRLWPMVAFLRYYNSISNIEYAQVFSFCLYVNYIWGLQNLRRWPVEGFQSFFVFECGLQKIMSMIVLLVYFILQSFHTINIFWLISFLKLFYIINILT